MKTHTQEYRDLGFVIGLLTGAFVGAGLVLWLAPRSASELGERLNDSAKSLGGRASAHYRQARIRVGEAIDDLTARSQDVRDDGAKAVARGATKVEFSATAVGSDRVAEARPHSATDRSPVIPHSL